MLQFLYQVFKGTLSLKKISSLQHPYVKHLVRLKDDRDYRLETGRVVVSGLKLISELSILFDFRTLLFEEGFSVSFSYKTEETYSVTPEILKKITGLKKPEPIAAEIDLPPPGNLASAHFLLILDGISDPGNLGTLLRTALALGWEGVFITTGSTDPFNEKALRAAKGATFKLPMKTGSLEELTELLKVNHFTLYAADAKGKNLNEYHFSSPLALALGNEAHGIGSPLKKIAQVLAVPMKNSMESLNVAAAGAILMYELKGRS